MFIQKCKEMALMLRPFFFVLRCGRHIGKISGTKYSVEYIAEYVVLFASMSVSDMSVAAYSLA